MQWTLIGCFFVIAVLCLIQGLRKSTFSRTARNYCSGCGWTTESVQSCEFEYQNASITAPLCFECSIEREAIPVKALEVSPSYAVG